VDQVLEKQGYETILPEPGQTQPPPRKFWSLSPLNRRRVKNLKANRRGYFSLRLFFVLFFVSLFAEFVANDRPIVISYKGEILFPVFNDYPEAKFGGFLATTDYRDPYIQDEILANGWMVWPPIRYSYRSVNNETAEPLPARPWWMMTQDFRCAHYPDGVNDRNCRLGNWNWLGTDDQGRDVVARLIYGFRISVEFGLTLAIISSIIGVLAGAVQGYFGGWVDLGFQRFIEVWTSIPALYLLLIISSVIVPSFFVLLGILLLFSWVSLVGVVRAEFLRGRNFEYINAARALGVSNRTIMFRHLLPNAMVATLTFLPLTARSPR
jgi:microcin C transport system permease protein